MHIYIQGLTFLFENSYLKMRNDHLNIKLQMLKLNGKLIRFTREGTYTYHIRKTFLKKNDPQPPHWHALKIYSWKELLSTEKLTHFCPKFLFYTPWKYKNVFSRT